MELELILIDREKVFELYHKAADLGNIYGIYNLEYCYKNGIGIDINKRKEFKLYQKVADLEDETVIEMELELILTKKRADLGNANGMNNLGICYQNGIGTDIDNKKAFELFQKAAKLENV
ncbi:hypothetical protein RclHR1_22650001 [Rhizophagus clarus]|uniref:Uncharacterized protein n=1 Tax=Rhizophagus clarus TaxID=94130 RepID=A0A2Z6RNY4_9GLOM|nr:hypothetical protein RclHR1_22650001 [Rhizophagus clarus]